jgi:signal transduction histidine kinase
MHWIRKLVDKRGVVIPILLTGLVTISVVASSTVFAQGDQTQRALTHAANAQGAEEVLTASTAIRGSTAVAVLVADAVENGRATDEELGLVLADFELARQRLTTRAARLGTSDLYEASSVIGLADTLSNHVDELSGLLRTGELEAAEVAVIADVLPSLLALEDLTITIRDDAVRRVAAEAGTAGALARAASIAVALIVPSMALLAFRWVQRRRQGQRDLELKLEHQLEQSTLKDEMIANLSHELRTPLTGVYGMALTLADAGFSDEALSRELIEIIVSESAELSRMVDDLLAVAKLDAGGLAIVSERIDPAELVTTAVAPFVRMRSIPIDCEQAEIVADSLRLKQVLRNIVSNAITHGGPHVEISAKKEGDQYRIAVTDDGPGLPDELLPRLFDRFIHDGAAPLTAGSVGLGLSIAHDLMQRMNGSLSYERTGGITSLLIELPLAELPGSEMAVPEIAVSV